VHHEIEAPESHDATVGGVEVLEAE